MKSAGILTSLMLLGTLAACGDRPESTATDHVDSLRAAAGVDRSEEIAGDKNAMADMIRRSHAKGTFDDALVLAMQDSTLAEEIFQAVRSDPRFTAPSTAAKSTTATGTAAKRSGTATTATAKRGDALDQTEQAVKKANERLEQAERVRREAEEARRKVQGIFRP